MPVTAELFERWKEAKSYPSDRQACLALGVSNGNPGHWREGKNAHAAVIERMARDLGYDDKGVAVLLFESMAEAASADADSRKTFERLARKVQALALTAVAVLASSSFPAPSQARSDAGADAPAIHYANFKEWLALAWRAVRMALGSPKHMECRDEPSPLLRSPRHHRLPAPAA